MATLVNRIFGYLGYVKRDPVEKVRFEDRAAIYATNQLLYDGDIYRTNANGGALEDVLKAYVGTGYTNVNAYTIQPFFMPFAEIADAYQNVWPGTLGAGMEIADQVDGRDVDEEMKKAAAAVWHASNLDTEKETLARWAANFGTVGLRVAAQPEEGDKPARAVLSVDHPSRLFNFEEDFRGNVTAVVLKYDQPVNFGTLVDPDWHSVEVVEQLTKEDFSRTEDGKEKIVDAARANTLGFCPYVILRHKDNGSAFGDWAYKGTESAVHRINWRLSRQDKSIDRHQFPKWFGAGGGKPTTVEMGEDSMTYVELKPDTPEPFLQAIVGDVNQAASQEFWQALRDLIRTRQPELNLNDVKLLANISGEALAQVLKPTEQAILRRRPAYDHALIRGLQMAVSAGISVGAFDLGTNGDGDTAFREGLEDFEFKPRPAIPETPQQRLVNAQADVAEKSVKFNVANNATRVISDPVKRLKAAGFSDEEAAELGAQATQTPPANGNGTPASSSRLASILNTLS